MLFAFTCPASSCPAKPPSAISRPTTNRAATLRERRAAFDERVEEMAQSYVDVLQLKARSGKHLAQLIHNSSVLLVFPLIFKVTVSHFENNV